MTTKEDLISSVTLNTRRGYLYSILKLSCVFFIIALVASYLGFTSLSTELSTISDNTFLAQVTFIGFVIAVNERIIEAFKRTFRRRTSMEYNNELTAANEILKNNPADSECMQKAKLWQSIVNDYSSETGRMCLTASLTIGCILSSVGIVSIFGGFENTDNFSNNIHIMLFDAVDIVLTGWVISGGSEGWTNFLNSSQSLFQRPTIK